MAKKAPLVPKVVQRLATRSAILMFIVAGMIYGFQKFQSLRGDLQGVGEADTAGQILAVQSLDEGSQVVVIQPDGSLVAAPGAKKGTTDRDAVWNSSGNRVFFVSDRDGQAFHLYRWNPSGGLPEKKSVDNSARSAPSFAVDGGPEADASLLITSRGNVEEFFPIDSKSQRVLPPSTRDIAQGEEAGALGAFQAVYSNIGESFREARWCVGKRFVAAVMRREGGEVLVVQSLEPNAQGALPAPRPIAAGERVEINVSPLDGALVFSVSAFDYATAAEAEQSRRNGKIVRPFRHLLGMIDFSEPALRPITIAATKNDELSFASPTFTPDGTKILLTAGPWADGRLTPQGLATLPAKAGGGGEQLTPIVKGEIYEPSYNKAGDKIVFCRKENGKRGVYVSGADGSGVVEVTGGKGDFSYPRFSPKG